MQLAYFRQAENTLGWWHWWDTFISRETNRVPSLSVVVDVRESLQSYESEVQWKHLLGSCVRWNIAAEPSRLEVPLLTNVSH
jgi:hypothetical protein